MHLVILEHDWSRERYCSWSISKNKRKIKLGMELHIKLCRTLEITKFVNLIIEYEMITNESRHTRTRYINLNMREGMSEGDDGFLVHQIKWFVDHYITWSVYIFFFGLKCMIGIVVKVKICHTWFVKPRFSLVVPVDPAYLFVIPC